MEKQDDQLRCSMFCPYCHEKTGIGPVSTTAGHPAVSRPRANEIWWMGECQGCHKMVLVFQASHRFSGQKGYTDSYTIYPTPLPSPTDERIPEIIRSDLMEAKLCYSIEAYKACSTMARRALEAACLEKGATGTSLYEKINALYTKGVITEEQKKWAHAVRLIGNDGAHLLDKLVTVEDAQDVLTLAEEFLNILYVTSAIAQAQLAKHDKS